MSRYIYPVEDLGALLLDVEKPVRYTGGEFGRLAKKDAAFQTIIAFPDLYEIGMSNQAVRIIYNTLNKMDGISCDRAFAPAPDFETMLREKGFPLYGLDTGISLKDAKLLLFTLGYELGITNVLTMLDLSGIPLHKEARGEDDPIVIMGGPCVSNPLPYSSFVDCFWIGEAEGGFFDLVREAAELEEKGAKRKELLKLFMAHPSVWGTGKKEARRAVDKDFSFREPTPNVFPVPSMKAVQHHGAVEIMRGCPNGCRFCHAGYWYRPMRQKSAAAVIAETEAFIKLGGYREISLSSLSTGDYENINSLVEALNSKYAEKHISFQLPSLRVSGFSLPLLEKVSSVRKSGLTFAVETPDDFRQISLNKKVSLESVVSILKEAKKNGWRGAKFYFMIGLPLKSRDENKNGAEDQNHAGEAGAIVDFVLEAARQTGMHFNINAGTFVPKPHTPYQRAAQLDISKAARQLWFIKEKLKAKGHKTGVQDPFFSLIEGVLSRGDERAGDIIEEAWNMGARLDSWSEFFKRDIWEKTLEHHKELAAFFLGAKESEQNLPWDVIESGVTETYFKKELAKSDTGEFTSSCINKCNNPCGICGKDFEIVKNTIHDDKTLYHEKDLPGRHDVIIRKENSAINRLLFTFTKEREGAFYSHLTLAEIFGMAMVRAEIPAAYSEGFNPLPRLEIVSPLAIGIDSRGETALLELSEEIHEGEFKTGMNKCLPAGIKIVDALAIKINPGEKKHSLSSMLYGASYETEGKISGIIPFREEKDYRNSIKVSGKIAGFKRNTVYAFIPGNPEKAVSYFEVFRKLYPAE